MDSVPRDVILPSLDTKGHFWRTALYMSASPVSLLLRSGPLLGASTVVIVTQSSTSSSYLNQLAFPSYDGGCLAVIDKLSVSSV